MIWTANYQVYDKLNYYASPKRQYSLSINSLPKNSYLKVSIIIFISISSKKLNYIRLTFATRNYEEFPACYAAVDLSFHIKQLGLRC